jgi:hypothetical protein
MNIFKNAQTYFPNDDELKILALYLFKTDEGGLPDNWKEIIGSEKIQYLRSEDNKDWYMSQHLFSPDTLKISYDTEGVIRAASVDVSMLPGPLNQSVTEIFCKDIPQGFAADGKWKLHDGVIIPLPIDYTMAAEKEKSSRYEMANKTIAPLQDAVDLAIATEEETTQLIAWKNYRVLLNRVDISLAPDIDWPLAPDTK